MIEYDGGLSKTSDKRYSYPILSQRSTSITILGKNMKIGTNNPCTLLRGNFLLQKILERNRVCSKFPDSLSKFINSHRIFIEVESTVTSILKQAKESVNMRVKG